jgi:hypothetical protein
MAARVARTSAIPAYFASVRCVTYGYKEKLPGDHAAPARCVFANGVSAHHEEAN